MGCKVNNQQGRGSGIVVKMNGRYHTPWQSRLCRLDTVIWGSTLTAALVDRLTHRAHIIMCDWESFRLKEGLKKRSPVRSNK